MPLVDWEIEALAGEFGLIIPFEQDSLSSMGYDLRLGSSFLTPITDAEQQIIDPFDPPEFQRVIKLDNIIIPPHSFVLGASVERISMPEKIIGLCLGRSTYARAGVITHVTPLEPGWIGYVTIEISNTNPLPVRVWVGRGITQVIFLESKEVPRKDYSSKGGRYQFQEGVVQGRPDRQESEKETVKETSQR